MVSLKEIAHQPRLARSDRRAFCPGRLHQTASDPRWPMPRGDRPGMRFVLDAEVRGMEQDPQGAFVPAATAREDRDRRRSGAAGAWARSVAALASISVTPLRRQVVPDSHGLAAASMPMSIWAGRIPLQCATDFVLYSGRPRGPRQPLLPGRPRLIGGRRQNERRVPALRDAGRSRRRLGGLHEISPTNAILGPAECPVSGWPTARGHGAGHAPALGQLWRR
jgi:hypothetical protein